MQQAVAGGFYGPDTLWVFSPSLPHSSVVRLLDWRRQFDDTRAVVALRWGSARETYTRRSLGIDYHLSCDALSTQSVDAVLNRIASPNLFANYKLRRGRERTSPWQYALRHRPVAGLAPAAA